MRTGGTHISSSATIPAGTPIAPATASMRNSRVIAAIE